MKAYISTFHEIVYKVDEKSRFSIVPGVEPPKVLAVLNSWQRDLRKAIEKSIGEEQLQCKVCNGLGFIYSVSQIVGKGTTTVSKGRDFTKDVKYKVYTFDVTFKGNTYTLKQKLPYLSNAYRYSYWGKGMIPEVIRSMVASAQKLLPEEIRSLLDEDNPLRLKNYSKGNSSVQKDTLSILQSAKNLVQFYDKLEQVLLQAGSKYYIDRKIIENAIAEIKAGWGDIKARLVIKKCPYCDGFGVNHIGHSETDTAHKLFYEIALELLDKVKSPEEDKFPFDIARNEWIIRSLKTVTIETRQKNLSKTSQDKQLAVAARQAFLEKYKQVFGSHEGNIYYLTPEEIFNTKKQVLNSSKYTFILVRNKFREDLKNEILEMLKKHARVSDDKRVKRHMIESLKSTVEQIKDAKLKAKTFGDTDIRQLTFTAQHWTTRFSGVANRKNPQYARFYSDWGGHTEAKPWSRSNLTIKQIINQAFDRVWSKYYYEKLSGTIYIDGKPYTREDYFKYIRVFGEDYV